MPMGLDGASVEEVSRVEEVKYGLHCMSMWLVIIHIGNTIILVDGRFEGICGIIVLNLPSEQKVVDR
jgi:hypothetical protein